MAVVGIGGVGSWAAEALARSGAGAIILMDLDDLCVTNTNRQIHALGTTIGQSKTEAMAARIRDINPEAEIITLDNFYTEANAKKLFGTAPDVIIDAIDSLSPEAHLIASCYRNKQPLITCGGAVGGQTRQNRNCRPLGPRATPCSPACAPNSKTTASRWEKKNAS